MRPSEVTVAWLQSLHYTIIPVWQGVTIKGVLLRDLKVNLDGRGEVTELWSQPWAADGFSEVVTHVYQSATDFGVVKCWHLHEIHTDQFTVTRGKLQVSLVDIRPDSPTFGQVNTVFMGSFRPRILRIPPGVMHGWKALTPPEVLVVNLQSHVYDPKDEFKFPWNCVLEDVWQPRNG